MKKDMKIDEILAGCEGMRPGDSREFEYDVSRWDEQRGQLVYAIALKLKTLHVDVVVLPDEGKLKVTRR